MQRHAVIVAFALTTWLVLMPAEAETTTAMAAAMTTTHTAEGKISHYGPRFAGRKTASGQVFDPAALTMAHKTLPFGTLVKITNLVNDRSVVLRVNDRGPVTRNRIGDVSSTAARQLGMLRAGVVTARLEVLSAGTP